jgi:TPP-dependent pyruvate/acetoin dehydrogenase alpha subunit
MLRTIARSRQLSLHRGFSSAVGRTLEELKQDFNKEILALPEQTGLANLEKFLTDKANDPSHARWNHIAPPVPPQNGYKYLMDKDEVRLVMDAALATFSLHVESRVAALVGKGFYTIGPCGEEMLAAIGMALEDQDDAALHYRHLGVSLARQLRRQETPDISQILLDRARGYTVSKHDPVTGGVHCSIGSHNPNHGRDYLVTSTLASQCPSAVGRALGYSLAEHQKVSERRKGSQKPISFVSIGDGSVHNGHFHSAFHLARHAKHLSKKCPTVFAISNNGISISYETQNYVKTMFDGTDPLIPVFQAQGVDMADIYDQTKQAAQYSRQRSAPSVILYQTMRRFGHAASDRQQAYLTHEQIESMAESDLLERAIVQAVDVFNSYSYAEVKDRFLEIRDLTQKAFSHASTEEKVTRQDMLDRVEMPMVACPALPFDIVEKPAVASKEKSPRKAKPEVMRKHMTRVLEESLENDPTVVYLGEDVEHGGYYLVTDQLVHKFPRRVIDFPPDETSLLGAAMGFAQVGLTPIVEIPYAKYLDVSSMVEIAPFDVHFSAWFPFSYSF